MLVLGIESSCDETAAAVVEDGLRVRSSVVASQADLHAEYGGVVPEIAGRAHVERISPVIESSLREAGVGLGDLDAVAVGHRPGLIGSLLVGVGAAKALSWSLGVPLVGVDHVHAHLWAALLGRPRDEVGEALPSLGLVVSGGHTAMYKMGSATALTRLGATIDDALGEAYDKAATMLGLGYPGGPALDALARAEGADPDAWRLPISTLGPDSLDFSFSGLKTAVLYAIRGVPRPKREGGGFPRPLGSLSDSGRRDLAAAFQRTAVRTAVLKLERALDGWGGEAGGGGARALIAGGGVTSNSLLRSELAALGRRRGLGVLLPEPAHCVDNAAMIAGLGHESLAERGADGLTLAAVPTTAC